MTKFSMKNKRTKFLTIIIGVIFIISCLGIIIIKKLHNEGYAVAFLDYKISDADKERDNKTVDVDKEKDPKDLSKEEQINQFLDKIEKQNIKDCEKILEAGLNPNEKCKDGQTVYNKTLNLVVKKLLHNPVGSTYLPIFDKMRKNVDISQLNVPKREELNEYQVMFLGCIGIDVRTQAEKDKETQDNIAKVKEEAKKTQDNIAKAKKIEKQNFNMNGLELLEQNTSDGGRYITGKLKNNNYYNCSYVEVKAKITDNNGNVLDTPISNITNLKSGEVWSFKIPVVIDISSGYKYQIIEMKCNH